jgi:group I intron endonuclease
VGGGKRKQPGLTRLLFPGYFMPHIYKITSPSNKIYIGSTTNIIKRLKKYSCCDCKGQIKLYRSLKKYGYKNHLVEIICECSEESMFRLEGYYGVLFNVLGQNGLNLRIPKHSDKFIGVSQETRDKIKFSQSCGKSKNIGRSAWNKGVPWPKEQRDRLSKLRVGVKLTPEQKIRQRDAILKVRSTPESRLKTSIASRYGNNPNAKKVVCVKTGTVFGSKSEAALSIGINSGTLGNYLRGRHKNKTTLKYLP